MKQYNIIFVYIIPRVIFIYKQVADENLSENEWVQKHEFIKRTQQLLHEEPMTDLQRRYSIFKCEWCFQEYVGWEARQSHENNPSAFCLKKRTLVRSKKKQNSM